MALVIEHAPNDDGDDEVVLALVIDGDYVELDWVKAFQISDGFLYLSAEERMSGQLASKYTVVKNWDQVAWVPTGESA